MALKQPAPKAEKSEDVATPASGVDTPVDPNAEAIANALKMDAETGKAITPGDENAKPNSDTGAVSPDAAENRTPPAVTEPTPTSDEKYVYVVNLKGHAQRQPSTGVWIEVGGGQYFAQDGWLENQLTYGLLKKAKDPAKAKKTEKEGE